MNKFTFDGSWNEIKGKLRQKYAQLTDDDLLFAEGKGDEFLGKLQSKIGVGADQLQKTLSDLKLEVEDVAKAAGGKYEAAKQKVTEVAHDVSAKVSEAAADLKAGVAEKAEQFKEKAQEVYGDACQRARTWNDDGEAYVREQPRTAMLTALVAGFLLGLLIRR